MKTKKNKGFTLVELIVVIAVLAILAVLAVVAFRGVQNAARESAISADASRLANQLNLIESLGDEGEAEGEYDALAKGVPVAFSVPGTDVDASLVIEGTDEHFAAVKAAVTRTSEGMWVNTITNS